MVSVQERQSHNLFYTVRELQQERENYNLYIHSYLQYIHVVFLCVVYESASVFMSPSYLIYRRFQDDNIKTCLYQ